MDTAPVERGDPVWTVMANRPGVRGAANPATAGMLAVGFLPGPGAPRHAAPDASRSVAERRR